MSGKIIEALILIGDYERMNHTTAHQVLVLGGTGKTGSRVAGRLSARGASVRTAARSGADVHFDWDNRATWEEALRGATSDVLDVTGTAPVTFAEFAAKTAPAWK